MVAFETTLTLQQEGNSTDDITDPFRDALLRTTGISLDALTKPPGVEKAWDRVAAGTIDWAFDSSTRTPMGGDNLLFGMPFGMEVQEWMSWYLNGGRTQQVANFATLVLDVVPYAINIRAGESGGWFKEPMTLKMMETGKYSTGEQVKYRGFGEATLAIAAVFPNVETPGSTPGQSNLEDFQNGVFNALEFGEPINDASVNGGLFPNYPAVDGSVIEAGAKHYYISSWFNPSRMRELWINKTYHDALTADEQANIELCARGAMMTNLANSLQGQDVVIKQFQTLGATIHRAWPADVLARLREGMAEVLKTAGEGDAQYLLMLDSIKAFAKANSVRWANGAYARDRRWSWAGWAPDPSL